MAKENKDKIYDEVEKFLIYEMGDYMDKLGAKHTFGRIFGLLLVSDDAQSLTEISKKVNLSKPAVSTIVKNGVQLDFFTKVFKNESPREDFYSVKYDFLDMMLDPGIHKLTMMLDKIQSAIEMIEKSDEDIPSDDKLKKSYKKLKYIHSAYALMLKEYTHFTKDLKNKLIELRKQIEE